MSLHLIIASHGLYAQEALNAAKMIIGQPRMDTHVLSVVEGRAMEDSYQELAEIFEQIPAEDEVLILVDLYGGTPSNVTTMLLLNQKSDERLQAYSGLNLPVLIELFGTNPQTLAEAKHLVELTYNNALVDLNKKTEGVNVDADQTL